MSSQPHDDELQDEPFEDRPVFNAEETLEGQEAVTSDEQEEDH